MRQGKGCQGSSRSRTQIAAGAEVQKVCPLHAAGLLVDALLLGRVPLQDLLLVVGGEGGEERENSLQRSVKEVEPLLGGLPVLVGDDEFLVQQVVRLQEEVVQELRQGCVVALLGLLGESPFCHGAQGALELLELQPLGRVSPGLLLVDDVDIGLHQPELLLRSDNQHELPLPHRLPVSGVVSEVGLEEDPPNLVFCVVSVERSRPSVDLSGFAVANYFKDDASKFVGATRD
mmetsp:Transcript_311/g.535  ORF Transcript_311/g.535 Transcript_311/m.535 type:complete len:232 (+) Transcript_311:530-1225(+)